MEMEFVYVVKRQDLFDLEFPQGFLARAEQPAQIDRYLDRIRERGFFLERRQAERDSSFKQVIPYVVLMRRGEVLLLRRTKAQGESRLHDKLSIGVGGHINPVDAGEALLDRAVRRELDEELALGAHPPLQAVGILNDDGNPVGSVHFGLVMVGDAREIDVEIRERDRMTGSFVSVSTVAELAQDSSSNFESWSAALIKWLPVWADQA